MLKNKSLLLLVNATIVLGFGTSSTYAHHSHSLVQPRLFQANLQVTAVTPTPSTGTCRFAAGTILPGVVQIGPTGGGVNSGGTEGAVYRLSVNSPSAFTILEEVIPNLFSGSYMFGTPGTGLATGAFTSTYTPVDGTTSYAETDQVTLIRISNGMQGNDNSQGNENQNQQ